MLKHGKGPSKTIRMYLNGWRVDQLTLSTEEYYIAMTFYKLQSGSMVIPVLSYILKLAAQKLYPQTGSRKIIWAIICDAT